MFIVALWSRALLRSESLKSAQQNHQTPLKKAQSLITDQRVQKPQRFQNRNIPRLKKENFHKTV